MKYSPIPALVRTLLLAFLLCAMTFTGCVSVLNPGDPPLRLQLKPTMPGAMNRSPINRQVAVAMPQAGEDVDSDSVMLLFSGRELRTLAGVRWSGSVPYIVQRSLINALDSTGALRGVGDDSAGLLVDVRLLTEIKDFSLHYSDSKTPPTAVVEATFRSLSLRSGKVLGTHTVTARSAASGTDNQALVAAMENALSKTLAQACPWIIGTVASSKTTE